MRKVLHLFQKLGQLLDSNLEEPSLKFVFVGGSCQIGTAEQMLACLVCWGWQCSPTSPCGRIRMRSTWFSQCQRWWLCSSRFMSADIWKMPLPLGVASVEPKHWEATSAYKRMSYIQPGWWLPIISLHIVNKNASRAPKESVICPTWRLSWWTFHLKFDVVWFLSLPNKKTSSFPASSHQFPLGFSSVKLLIPTCGKFWLTKGV